MTEIDMHCLLLNLWQIKFEKHCSGNYQGVQTNYDHTNCTLQVMSLWNSKGYLHQPGCWKHLSCAFRAWGGAVWYIDLYATTIFKH